MLWIALSPCAIACEIPLQFGTAICMCLSLHPFQRLKFHSFQLQVHFLHPTTFSALLHSAITLNNDEHSQSKELSTAMDRNRNSVSLHSWCVHCTQLLLLVHNGLATRTFPHTTIHPPCTVPQIHSSNEDMRTVHPSRLLVRTGGFTALKGELIWSRGFVLVEFGLSVQTSYLCFWDWIGFVHYGI